MADIEYSIKSTLPIKVTVGASEASATICWLGAVKDNTNCLNCEEEKIYCENVYIGANDCTNGESSARTISADSATTTIFWHDIPIPYEIIQSAATCSSCGEVECTVDVLNHWVSPYIVEPCASSTTLYWEYWITKEDECDIFREKVLSSTTLELGNSACIDCHEENRTQTGNFNFELDTESCHLETKIPYEYYIQKLDVCCDLSGDCYEINEIVYNPTTVPSSGGEVEFSFDYKKIEIDENCEPKETYGTYFGKWNVPGCDEDTVDCCFNRAITSSFTWNDICGRGDLCVITTGENDNGEDIEISSEGGELTFEQHNDKNTIYLSILREKSFSADCDAHCEFQTVYCLDKDSVTVEHYDYSTGQWIAADTSYDPEENVVTTSGYIWEYGGGRMRVKWNYQTITIYEDCTVGIASATPFTDVITVYEYDDCDTCVKLKCDKKRVNNKNSDTVTITAINPNDEDTVENEIVYKFKKGFCELQKDERQWQFIAANIPNNFQYLVDNCVGVEEGMGCNEFLLTYVQEKKPCDPYCPPCLTRYMIEDVVSGGTAAYVDDDHPISKLIITYREDCDIEVDTNDDYDTGEKCLGDWVTVEQITYEGSPAFKFNVSENTGPYRRGKVKFWHDERKCKEEVIITQLGDAIKVRPFEPSDCVDLSRGEIIDNKTRGQVTITAVYTPPVPESDCAQFGEAKVVQNTASTAVTISVTYTPPLPQECSASRVTYTRNTNLGKINECGGKVELGTYTYTCADFNISNLGFYPKNEGMTEIIVQNYSGLKQGTIYGVFDVNSDTDERRVHYTIEYDDVDVEQGGEWYVTQLGGCENSDFQNLLTRFNAVLDMQGYNEVTKNGNTSAVYDYLKEGYDLAVTEYNNDAIGLYDASLYGNGNVNQFFQSQLWGSKSTYEGKEALSALTSWLMAMQLTELVADEEIVTNGTVEKNTQTLLFEEAMEIGGGNTIPLFNNYTIKGDVTVSRIVASALYSKIRSEYSSIDTIPSYRTKMGGSAINISARYLGFEESNSKTCETGNLCDKCLNYVTKIGYAIRENGILPPAPGPYARVWTDAIYDTLQSCLSTTAKDTLANRQGITVNGEKLIDPRGSIDNYISSASVVLNEKKNYKFDDVFGNYIANNYNLNNTAQHDGILERTVQAVADSNESIKYLFSNDIFYNYATASECYNRSFTPATSASHNGVIKGVYGKDVTNKDLLSTITTSRDIRDFFDNVGFCASVLRKTLLNDQYGRMRAGSANDGGIDSQSRCTTDTTTACTKWNHLQDSSIEGLVGGTTKYDANNNAYFVDANNNNTYEEGEARVLANGTCELNTEGVVSNTYPSGHASELWAIAMILMEIFPDRIKQIYNAGNNSCVSRAIVRAHWYSDTLMGRLNASMHIPILHAVIRMECSGDYNFDFRNFEVIKSIFNNLPDVN